MANLSITPAWVNGIYQIEPEDPVIGGPDGISNIQAKQLGSRTEFLKQQLAEAQQDLEAVGTDGQNALWAAVERAVSEAGLLTKEMARQQTVAPPGRRVRAGQSRHQERLQPHKICNSKPQPGHIGRRVLYARP